MPVKFTLNKSRVPVNIYTDDFDHGSLDQLGNLAQMPFIHHNIAAMPDVHVGIGIGATVASVIPTKGAIIPAAVGVDIGCDMNAIRLSLKATDLPDSLRQIRSAIEAKVPVGFDSHKDLAYFEEGTKYFDDYIEAVGWAQDYATTNRREMMRLVLAAIQPLLPPFTTTKEAINCHHNYVNRENHFGAEVYLTRKGAISAYKGELGIIHDSIGAKSFIVRGLENEQSFCSCSHGAGRVMSRSKAKKLFDADYLVEQTKGAGCRKDIDVVDEIPSAYKDIDRVMENQNDLIKIVHTLKEVKMAKVKRNKPRNPVAVLPIMRKGGVHEKSRSAERQQGKQKLKQLVSKVEAGLSGLDCVWRMAF